MATRQDAIDALKDLAGTEEGEASTIVDAFTNAAKAEALAVSAGEDVLPSSITEARVLRLRLVAEQLESTGQRPLSEREVTVLMRITPTQARNAMRLLALRRPDLGTTWLAEEVKRGQVDPHEATMERPATYEITFSGPEVLDYAVEILTRKGITRGLSRRRQNYSLVVPQQVPDRQGQAQDPKAVLGI